MKAETREWVKYAEEDYEVACFLMRRRSGILANTVAFHCQQCAEKYLKACLIEAGRPVVKTHDLESILRSVLPLEPLWAAYASALQDLTNYAVKFRYPGHVATRNDAKRALKDCRAIRAEVRLNLGLPKKK